MAVIDETIEALTALANGIGEADRSRRAAGRAVEECEAIARELGFEVAFSTMGDKVGELMDLLSRAKYVAEAALSEARDFKWSMPFDVEEVVDLGVREGLRVTGKVPGGRIAVGTTLVDEASRRRVEVLGVAADGTRPTGIYASLLVGSEGASFVRPGTRLITEAPPRDGAQFEWDDWGSPRAFLPFKDNIVKSLISGDLGASTTTVERFVEWLDRGHSEEPEISLEGYALEVSGPDVTISSNYDQFPDTIYTLVWLRDTIAAYDAWLRENLARRPR